MCFFYLAEHCTEPFGFIGGKLFDTQIHQSLDRFKGEFPRGEELKPGIQNGIGVLQIGKGQIVDPVINALFSHVQMELNKIKILEILRFKKAEFFHAFFRRAADPLHGFDIGDILFETAVQLVVTPRNDDL